MPIEVHVPINATLKYQLLRNLGFWKFVSLYPVRKIEFHLGPESFLFVREYTRYYCVPFLGRVVGQFIELEMLPYLNFRFHTNSFLPSVL
jgi:hypothetical protein